MRRRPAGPIKQARTVNRLADESAEMLGLSRGGVEKLTRELAPIIRQGSGTEGDVLVLVHRLAELHEFRGLDVESSIRSTINAIGDGTLKGTHLLPLREFIRDPQAVFETVCAVCGLLWPAEFLAYEKRARARGLQEQHAHLTANAMLIAELEQLNEVEAEMKRLGVEVDTDLIAQARSSRDEAGMPAPIWET